MDEAALLKAFERLRGREGLSLARMRAEPDLMTYLGCDDASEAMKRLVHVAGSIDAEPIRLAVLAALGVGFAGRKLEDRREVLSSHYEARDIIKGTERIRQESREGFSELAQLMISLHNQAKAKVAPPRFSPLRIVDNMSSINTSFGSSLSIESSGSSSAKYWLRISTEFRRGNAWLVHVQIAQNHLGIRVFESDLSSAENSVMFYEQAGFKLSDGEFSRFNSFEIKIANIFQRRDYEAYFVQLASSYSTWHYSAMHPVIGNDSFDFVIPDDMEDKWFLASRTQADLVRCHDLDLAYEPGTPDSERHESIKRKIDEAKAYVLDIKLSREAPTVSSESELVQD